MTDSIAFLNNVFVPLAEAKISPLDRGFLFGDGIYEVVPSYSGKMVGFAPHIQRMQNGLQEIGIELDWTTAQWQTMCDELITRNGKGNLGIYLHVSRGADDKRFHAYPDNISPTIFAFAFEIAAPPVADKKSIKGYKVSLTEDLRWQRCHIKSTALLGNVMHFQQGHAQGKNETLLYNRNHELTEASASNAYIVKDGTVYTPQLDNQILAGITRYILLDALRKEGSIPIVERAITIDEVFAADEVWITSSSKEIAPVIEVDSKVIGDGKVGDVWQAAQTIFSAHKFDY